MWWQHYDEAALKNNLQRSLRASFWDGISWSLTVGFSEAFFGPLAIFLGAADVTIGLLATLPQVIGDFSQLATASLVKAVGSRRRLVLMGISLQTVALLCASALALRPWHGLAAFMILSVLYWSAWMVITPAWQSWMGDLVPDAQRGRYFGWRSRWIQIVTLCSLVAGGLLLESFRNQKTAAGFGLLMALGAAGRILSLIFVGRQTDVPEPRAGRPGYSLGNFLKDLRRTNFGKFVLFVSLFAAAINVSGSYFVPFVLEELGLGYARFMILLALMFGTKFLTVPVWGRLSDRYGSRRLFVLSCAFFCLPPLLLLLSRNFYYLFLVQIIGGIGVGGFELCSFNFLLDNTEPERRTQAAAYYQVLTGFGIVSGAIAGGLLLKHSPMGLKPFAAVFLISGILRVILSLVLLPRVREIRKVPHVSYRRLIGQLVRFQKSVAE